MFWHNFKYTLKTLLNNKMLIFWTYAFPLILGTFFYLAFSDIENNEKLDIIDIAIVDNVSFNTNTIYKETFKSLSSMDNEKRLFNIVYVSENEAISLLENKKITGYLLFSNKPEIFVNESGINETVFKYVVEEIEELENVIQNVTEYQLQDKSFDEELNVFYGKIYQDVLTMYSSTNNIQDVSSNNLSYTMIEFYTLIAMACLYGAILGMYAVNQNLANMSSKGKRIEVSPVAKIITIGSSAAASFVVEAIGLVILFLYTTFVLNVDYGNNILLVIILALAGVLAGTTMGIAIASTFKTNENTKTGIIISITMLGCFFSGMMGITMKYVIDKNIPIINKINPASMITDGFYSLYYYDTLDRFIFNVISLLIFSVIMLFIATISLRRTNYECI